MDINDLRGLSTVLLMVAFIGLVIWAYSRKRQQAFDEAANLPFADDDIDQRTTSEERPHD
jgi:cytochrome c oxidase cbb3-type subunit 4